MVTVDDYVLGEKIKREDEGVQVDENYLNSVKEEFLRFCNSKEKVDKFDFCSLSIENIFSQLDPNYKVDETEYKKTLKIIEKEFKDCSIVIKKYREENGLDFKKKINKSGPGL
jgi:hypothetical protein